MKTIKNVLICGLGAIGSIYAVNLYEDKNVNLKVLVDETRFERYKKEPLLFNGKEYFFDYVTPKYSLTADLIIIATKSTSLDWVIKAISGFVGKDTIILSLLNGLCSEEMLAESFGADNVLYSYYIGHTSTRIGRNVTHDGVYTTVYGEKDNTVYSPNVCAVKNFFDLTGIHYKIPEDMEYSRWWKFLVNVGYNQASAVLEAPYKVFQNSQRANNIALHLMQEAVEVAKASGVKNTEKLIPEVLEILKTMIPEAKTSLLQDIEAHRKTEVDIFGGYVSTLGKKYNIKTPYNDIIVEIIKAIEER